MVKIMGMFHNVEDQEAFLETYYQEVLPVLLNVPGIIKIETTRLNPSPLTGEEVDPDDFFFQADLYFPNAEALENMLASPEGAQAAGVFLQYAGKVCKVYMGQEYVHYKHTF
ncbi:EthD family reductase [Risungbinella massiliensis]|uniref:EthD family reductase n=1 Tax=Risungbinella massiliensis TaxID=1329796 RepID=UPI0005CBCFE3|nr:EthD family reductase [Risungbinella massiliensis]